MLLSNYLIKLSFMFKPLSKLAALASSFYPSVTASFLRGC